MDGWMDDGLDTFGAGGWSGLTRHIRDDDDDGWGI